MERLRNTALGAIVLTATTAVAHIEGLLAPEWAITAMIASLGALLAVVAWGSADPSLGMYGPTLNAVPRAKGRLALTFDDGPHPEATEAILAALNAHRASATFFLLVDRAEAHPELARRIARHHEVGLHGLEHTPWLTMLAPERGEAQLREARTRLEAIIGRPVRMYRPPFGAVSPRLYESVRRAGLRLVWCSVRTRDGGRLAPSVLRDRCARADAGDIVLLHEGPPTTRDLLPTLLDDLGQRGLKPVSVGTLCGSV